MAVDLSKLITREKIEIRQLSGKTIAIDAYNVLYQFLSIIRQPDGTPLKDSKGRVTSHLSGLFYRSIELVQNGVTPIYVFEGDIGSPYGVMLITPIFSNGNLDKAEDIIRQKVKGSLVKTSVVTDVLVGNLGFRKIDTIKTWPYETLVKEYDYKTETEE